MPHELPEKKMNNKYKKGGNLFFEVMRDWIWEGKKKITLRNDRYLDIQNINNNK